MRKISRKTHGLFSSDCHPASSVELLARSNFLAFPKFFVSRPTTSKYETGHSSVTRLVPKHDHFQFSLLTWSLSIHRNLFKSLAFTLSSRARFKSACPRIAEEAQPRILHPLQVGLRQTESKKGPSHRRSYLRKGKEPKFN